MNEVETAPEPEAPPTPAPVAEATSTPATALSGWAEKAVHKDITLPSGQKVSIKVPNLPAMLKADAVPNDLIEAAIGFQQASKVTPEMLKEQWDFIRWVVPITVVEPAVSENDVEHLPAEDVDMIAGFASRTVDIDAVGHHLGGLETSADWRRFRGQLNLDEALEGL